MPLKRSSRTGSRTRRPRRSLQNATFAIWLFRTKTAGRERPPRLAGAMLISFAPSDLTPEPDGFIFPLLVVYAASSPVPLRPPRTSL
jgi:hypothetical protein